jgi:hypothetical protein
MICGNAKSVLSQKLGIFVLPKLYTDIFLLGEISGMQLLARRQLYHLLWAVQNRSYLYCIMATYTFRHHERFSLFLIGEKPVGFCLWINNPGRDTIWDISVQVITK